MRSKIDENPSEISLEVSENQEGHKSICEASRLCLLILNNSSEVTPRDFLTSIQLYKLSGGNQVDGLPPAASLLVRLENPDFSHALDHPRKLS